MKTEIQFYTTDFVNIITEINQILLVLLYEKQDYATMSSVLSSIHQRTSEAIKLGATMYDNGNISGCENIYMNLQQEIISDCEKNLASSNKNQSSRNLVIGTHKIMTDIKLLPLLLCVSSIF